jgi:hypothetical protein
VYYIMAQNFGISSVENPGCQGFAHQHGEHEYHFSQAQ